MSLSTKGQRTLLWLTGGVLTVVAVAALFSAFWTATEMTRPTKTQTMVLASAKNETNPTPTLEAFEPYWSLPLQQPLYDPPKVEIKIEKPKPPPFKARLTGTVLESDQPMALLITSDGQIVIRRVGQVVEEATIEAIEQNRVLLRYYEQSIELTMDGQ